MQYHIFTHSGGNTACYNSLLCAPLVNRQLFVHTNPCGLRWVPRCGSWAQCFTSSKMFCCHHDATRASITTGEFPWKAISGNRAARNAAIYRIQRDLSLAKSGTDIIATNTRCHRRTMRMCFTRFQSDWVAPHHCEFRVSVTLPQRLGFADCWCGINLIFKYQSGGCFHSVFPLVLHLGRCVQLPA